MARLFCLILVVDWYENGFEIEAWIDVKTVWAGVSNLHGREYFEAAAVQAEQTVKFTIRYLKDLDTSMRILFKDKEIISALKDIGVPVRFQTYSGKEETYITFFTYLDKPELHSDDEELITAHYIQIDVWSKIDYTELVKEVHQSMLKANFIKLNFYDLYEDDTKTYHKVMRFFKEVI